jgi:hypothetical protein
VCPRQNPDRRVEGEGFLLEGEEIDPIAIHARNLAEERSWPSTRGRQQHRQLEVWAQAAGARAAAQHSRHEDQQRVHTMRWHKGRAGWRLQLVLLWATLATVGCQRDKPRDCGASSCYQVLGLGSKASDDDIKKAYRRLAKEWHPDKNPDKVEEAQAQFMEIGNAYEILSTERASYDNLLRYGGSPFGGGGGFGRQHNFYRGQQQQRWHRESAGGDGGGALMGLLVPLGILVYVLSSQFNGGGAAAAGGGAARGDRKQAGAESSEKEQEDERTPSNLLPKGTRVQVQGLQSAAAAALNGTRGGVVRALPPCPCPALLLSVLVAQSLLS